jgi:myo-inositol-1(or 4)-monophosphatase
MCFFVTEFTCKMKETLLNAAFAAAKTIREGYDSGFTIAVKEGGINDLVTEIDLKSEKAIIEVIQQAHPDHQILSEETGSVLQDSPYKWIIDPIDGTINFAQGIPICAVSIGLEKDGEMIMGVVYNPFMNEFFFAEKGKGAFLNDKQIAVSQKDRLLKSCLVTGFPYSYLDEKNGPLTIFEKFIRKGVPVRRLGSAAIDLCWVACGRFDGFYEHSLKPWDSAAGILIVTEAGGQVTHFGGEPFSPYQPQLLATNGLIHEKMIRVLAGGEVTD